jgi:hypothetical protein
VRIGLPIVLVLRVAHADWTHCVQCTNRSQYLVAFYALKVAGEPDYPGSSGCMLTIDEAYPHLAAGALVPSLTTRVPAHSPNRGPRLADHHATYSNTRIVNEKGDRIRCPIRI